MQERNSLDSCSLVETPPRVHSQPQSRKRASKELSVIHDLLFKLFKSPYKNEILLGKILDIIASDNLDFPRFTKVKLTCFSPIKTSSP